MQTHLNLTVHLACTSTAVWTRKPQSQPIVRSPGFPVESGQILQTPIAEHIRQKEYIDSGHQHLHARMHRLDVLCKELKLVDGIVPKK